MRWSLGLLSLLPSFTAAQTWVQLAGPPGAARDDGAAFSVNGSIFMGTGMVTGWQLSADMWRYDGAVDQWSTMAAFPGSARQYCAGFETGGFGYLFGGLDAGGPLNELWVHLPVNAVWYQLASMPSAPRMGSTALVIGNRVFVIGGRVGPGTNTTNEVWEYRPFLDVWEQKSPFPGIGREQAAGFVVGNYAFIVGGQDANGNRLNDTWRYEPDTDSWTPMANLPAAGRSGATGLGLSSSGLLICGSLGAGGFTDEVWRYLPGLDSWEPAATFPGGPRKGGVGGVMDGAYAFYGTGSDAQQRYADWYGFGTDVSSPERSTDPLIIFPDPAPGTMYVRPAPAPGTRAVVLDGMGRTIAEMHMGADGSLDTGPLKPGRYWLRLFLPDSVHTMPFTRIH